MAKKSKIGGLSFLIIIGLIAGGGYWFYENYFKSTVSVKGDYEFVYVQSGYDLNDLIFDLQENNIVKDADKFEWLADKMDLQSNIHPGKYRVTRGMTYRQLINLIKYDKQELVDIHINIQIHDIEDFCQYISKKLELDKRMLQDYFSDNEKLNRDFGLNTDNAFGALLMKDYKLSWAITLPDFIEELKKTFHEFWTEEKKQRAKNNTGLSVAETIVLASIVQNESRIATEQQKIAGVYLNRLKKNMLLQADPTLVFANKAWGSQRVYNKDKEIDSPYNTYKYKGLPPGPISLVSTIAITNVIEHTKHNYIFFCAKPELNGYSNYSETYEQHQAFAKSYQRSLNKKGIK